MVAVEALNCIDIIKPYVAAVTREGMPPVQLMGGVGSVALTHEDTVILSDERRVVAPANLSLSQYRDDGNLRDVETLVLSSDKSDADRVEESAKETIGDNLAIDVFGILDIARAGQLLAKPFGLEALKTFLSDRYMPGGSVVADDGPTPERMLFPFSVPIPVEALETWTLEIGDAMEIPIPAPGSVIINYLTRSVSGLRHKDSIKVQKMAKTIFDRAPEVADWIVDGPGNSQFELARLLHTLRESKARPQTLTVGEKLTVEALPLGSTVDHPAFMLRDAETTTKTRALRLAAIKSRGLHLAESVPFVVTAFQKYVEPRISSVIHNR